MDEQFDQNLEKRFSRREILMEKYIPIYELLSSSIRVVRCAREYHSVRECENW